MKYIKDTTFPKYPPSGYISKFLGRAVPSAVIPRKQSQKSLHPS